MLVTPTAPVARVGPAAQAIVGAIGVSIADLVCSIFCGDSEPVELLTQAEIYGLTQQQYNTCLSTPAGSGQSYDFCDTAGLYGVPNAFPTSPTVGGANAAGLIGDDLAGAANRAAARVGPGSGPVHGTHVHTAFADELAALGRSDVFSEVSYLNGQVVPFGTRGSVRLDVVVGSPSSPTAIYDLKTGSASLTTSRVNQIQSHLPAGFQDIPVLEVRPG